MIPAIIYACIIFVASSIHGTSLPSIALKVHDKIIHSAEYFLLGFLIIWGLHYDRPLHLPDKRAVLAVLIGALYGALDEIHQYFVPGRSSEVQDWLADLFGVILAVLAYRKLSQIGRFIRWRFNASD